MAREVEAGSYQTEESALGIVNGGRQDDDEPLRRLSEDHRPVDIRTLGLHDLLEPGTVGIVDSDVTLAVRSHKGIGGDDPSCGVVHVAYQERRETRPRLLQERRQALGRERLYSPEVTGRGRGRLEVECQKLVEVVGQTLGQHLRVLRPIGEGKGPDGAGRAEPEHGQRNDGNQERSRQQKRPQAVPAKHRILLFLPPDWRPIVGLVGRHFCPPSRSGCGGLAPAPRGQEQ